MIGAGWSGLACALELSRLGFAVVLFDAAPQVGGRARALDLRLGDRSFALDNGQHLLIGAYGETLRLMAEAGVDIGLALLRLPFEIRYPDGFALSASRLPAPLHLAGALLTARGLTWRDRRHALAFVLNWRKRNWRIVDDAPAITLFAGAPLEIVRRLWRPLCVAALNVELEQASARVLLNVLRDSLAGGSRSADLLVPRHDLTRMFAAPALGVLDRRGVELRLRRPVQRLARHEQLWRIESRGEVASVNAVVLALPPQRSAALLASAVRADLEPAVAMLTSIRMAPIATVYLRYSPRVRLPGPAFALLDDADAGRYAQWAFDRGQLDAANAGIVGVVISAAGRALVTESASLVDRVAAQLSSDLGLPTPLAGTVVAEKRATIVPEPGLQRPPTRLPAAGLYLAGDAADGEYPSTLEGSVRSGLAAARALAADWAAL